MSSIIEGYNYDIFISYRQKDNKRDGWVTEFVDALKGELEATFKEDVSVYFDENPHDRLQETHNVDKSLEGKLNCLIFIPILSQTYCDPKSYAWQYEFLPFLRITENDRFGKHIKLRKGNVASRILPIRIHDLEPEDVILFEKETGSVLRALDFVFKTSTGVNRTLKANEDHPNDNINKTFYSDQVNKLTLAIKEIILALKAEPATVEGNKILSGPLDIDSDKANMAKESKAPILIRPKWYSFAVAGAIMIIIVVVAYLKFFRQATLDNLISSDGKISVVVMPFRNMTNDTICNVWQDGIKDNLITYLSNYSEDLTVRQTEAVNGVLQGRGLTNYAAITPSVARDISKKLEARLIIAGSISQAGDRIRVNAQLINSKTEEAFKSFQIEGSSQKEIFNIIDSLSVLVKDFLIISVMEKEIVPDFRQLISTHSSEAYRHYMYGNQAFYKLNFPSAREEYLKAAEIDTNFTEAVRMLSYTYMHLGLYEESIKLSLHLYEKKDQLTILERIWAESLHSGYFDPPVDRIKYAKQLLDYNDQMPVHHSIMGGAYFALKQYDKAIPEFEKELELYDKWGSRPRWSKCYTSLGYCYHKTGQYRKERMLYKKAERDFPDDPSIIMRQTILALSSGKKDAADRYIEKFKSLRELQGASSINTLNALGNIYWQADILNEAEEYFREVMNLRPQNPDAINKLAYFLIDTDRNINEGLELADKALLLRPDYYISLDTKGFGLYKQGKYEDAKLILEKSWELKPDGFDDEIYFHIEDVKKAIASNKNN